MEEEEWMKAEMKFGIRSLTPLRPPTPRPVNSKSANGRERKKGARAFLPVLGVSPRI